MTLGKYIAMSFGFDSASCKHCTYLGSECDGGEPEYSVSWPSCMKVDRYQHLKSFPFKKDMECFNPDFWKSYLSSSIRNGEHEEVMQLITYMSEEEDRLEQEYEWTKS